MHICYLALLFLCSLCSSAHAQVSIEDAQTKEETYEEDYSDEYEEKTTTVKNTWDRHRQVNVTTADDHHSNMLIHGEWEGEEPPEDTLKVVARMGNELGIKDPLNDVFQAYRGKVPKETNCKPIWVHMIDQKARDKWVAAYNHKDNWRIFHHEDWYLTGRLQPPVNYTGELNPAVKKWAKKKKYKTHMEGVHVYYRKNKTSDIFRVTNMEHLGYLKNKTEEHKWEIPVKTHDGIEQKKYMNSILKHF